MVGRPEVSDAPFFAQWSEASAPRSLDSARALTDRLSFTPPPSLAILGSKGKGTAAIGATRALLDAGLDVVTVTSPSLVSNRERIRTNGVSLSSDEYAFLAGVLARELPHLPTSSYLSPSGAYTVMGAWWASQAGADVLVLEEGMGGATDEVSLFTHEGLALTEVFREHVGILGDSAVEIARNLLGAGPAPLVASAPQCSEVADLVARVADGWGAQLLGPVAWDHRNPLVGASLGLGYALGNAFAPHSMPGLSRVGFPSPTQVFTPGRSSVHEGPTGRWFVDGAISPAGVEAAFRAVPFDPAVVLGCWPRDKQWEECAALARRYWGPERVHLLATGTHLDFPPGLPRLADLNLCGDVVAVGTQSFIGEVLTRLGADTAWFPDHA